MNGDGYTDLSGGLLYYISDGTTPIPGGLDAFGVEDTSSAPGELLAWTGDFDPAIEGHGTLTASNIVGQGVINGKAPTFNDLPGGKYAGAVLGGAPNAKLAPFGDIYFGFDFSTQFGYFLSTRHGVDVTSNSYGSSTSRQRRLGRREPGSRRDPRRLQDDRRCSPPATAPRLRHGDRAGAARRRSRSARRRSSAAPAGTRSPGPARSTTTT